MAKTVANRSRPTKVKKPSARSGAGVSKSAKTQRTQAAKSPKSPRAKTSGTPATKSRATATRAALLKPPVQQALADAKAAHGDIPPWTAAEIDEAFRRFQRREPHPKGELQHTNVFTLLVAVVLSAQATDAGVNKATPALFAAADTPAKMAALGEATIRDLVKSIGLFRTKAKNVAALAQILVEKYHGEVPHTRDELQTLPGVGRKTANVVLNMAFGEPTMAVDTHIFRIGNRTGLAPGKNPLEVENKLVERIPAKYMRHAHHWLILHGRYTCLARRPLCETCIIADLCKWPGKIVAV
jgi:endonuclease-3